MSEEERQRWRGLPETDAFFWLIARMRHDAANLCVTLSADGQSGEGPAHVVQAYDQLMRYMSGVDPIAPGRAQPPEVDDFRDPAAPDTWRTPIP